MAKKFTYQTKKGLIELCICEATGKVTVTGAAVLISTVAPLLDDGDKQSANRTNGNISFELSGDLIRLTKSGQEGSININSSIENNKICVTVAPVGADGSKAVYCEVMPKPRIKNPPG